MAKTIDRKFFFNTVRSSLFGNHLTEAQVAGMNAILDEIEAFGITSPAVVAAIMAVPYHETGRRMVPVREGFASTDAGARAAVANLFARGKIKRNYALPHKNGNSYYGRGYCQLTHGDNYKAASPVVGVDLYADPDKALDPHIGAKLMIHGMVNGTFRKGHSLGKYVNDQKRDYVNAREIINGDKNHTMTMGKVQTTIGKAYATYCIAFEKAVRFGETAVIIPLKPSVDMPQPVPVDPAPKEAYIPPSRWDRFVAYLNSLFS
jgi:predicted chitinase